jgi:hypothetical protein
MRYLYTHINNRKNKSYFPEYWDNSIFFFDDFKKMTENRKLKIFPCLNILLDK